MKRDEFDAVMKDFHARMKEMQPAPKATSAVKYGPPDCRIVTPEGRALIERMRQP